MIFIFGKLRFVISSSAISLSFNPIIDRNIKSLFSPRTGADLLGNWRSPLTRHGAPIINSSPCTDVRREHEEAFLKIEFFELS